MLIQKSNSFFLCFLLFLSSNFNFCYRVISKDLTASASFKSDGLSFDNHCEALKKDLYHSLVREDVCVDTDKLEAVNIDFSHETCNLRYLLPESLAGRKLAHYNVPESFIYPMEDKCYVLAVSGGANRGAWQSGVMRGWVAQHLERYGYSPRWDVVGGVSIGAMISTVSLFTEPGDELTYTDTLWNIWVHVTQDMLSDCVLPLWRDVIRYVMLSIKAFFTGKATNNYICNNKPLRDFLTNHFKDQLRPHLNSTYVETAAAENRTVGIRQTAVSAVEYETGHYKTWNSSYYNLTDLFDATVASTAIPVAFPPVKINSSHYIDGGVLNNFNLEQAIQWCIDSGKAKSYSDIVIDAVEAQPDGVTSESYTEHPTIFQVMERSFEIMHYKARGIFLLNQFHLDYPDVLVRYYIAPTLEQYEQFPKNFFDGNNRTGILNMLKIGLAAGWNATFFNGF